MAADKPTDMKESKELDVIAAPARLVEEDVENGESNSIHKGSNEEIAADTIAAATEYSPEQYRKLLWKIDLYLLPVMWVCEMDNSCAWKICLF